MVSSGLIFESEKDVITALNIGKRHFEDNLIQGPLAGVSSAPFRLLCSQYSKPAYCCTEMLSAKTLIFERGQIRERLLKKDRREGPLCFQLAGSDAKELAEATRIASDLGADLIDLNSGCPVKKIRKKGAGSRLLTVPTQLYQVLAAMKSNSTCPLTVKIRVDGPGEESHAEIAKVVMDAGVDALIVHGRHWTQHYETPCRLDAIADFVSRVTIPVIGNGDVSDLASLKAMFSTGCKGVMIGRAGVGQPWLLAQLRAEARGQVFKAPSLEDIAALFLEHVRELIQLLGSEKFALLQARKLAKYYARPLSTRAAFADAVNACDKLDDLSKLVSIHFLRKDFASEAFR